MVMIRAISLNCGLGKLVKKDTWRLTFARDDGRGAVARRSMATEITESLDCGSSKLVKKDTWRLTFARDDGIAFLTNGSPLCVDDGIVG
jgi:hypothetical protein